MNKPSVSVRNLTKSFSGRRVVDGLSFDVQKVRSLPCWGTTEQAKAPPSI